MKPGPGFAKRALVVVAREGHNVLMIDSPGTGKLMLATRQACDEPAVPHAVPHHQQNGRDKGRIWHKPF